MEGLKTSNEAHIDFTQLPFATRIRIIMTIAIISIIMNRLVNMNAGMITKPFGFSCSV